MTGKRLLAVDVGQLTDSGSQEDARRLLADAGATFPAGFTDADFVVDDYDVGYMPTTAFFDKGGYYRSSLGVGLSAGDLADNAAGILE